MTFTSIPSLYNHSFQSDEAFTANFVARRQLLDTLCRRLKANGNENDGQHQLLIGTRGMGKTSLLRRLAIEIDNSQELSEYFIPLLFREEQYNVLHLRDFWQNCGEALAEWAEAHDHNELAERLDEALCSEAWTDDNSAADQFLGEMNALGKRAVLMVDNLDLILDALKDADRWTLRGSLQLRGGPIIIGAATQSLRESADRDAAFYEFFQPSYLEPLSLTETEKCMRVLAKGRDELGKRVVSILNSDPARLKVLHRLSGGNPRVLALTYRFLETADTNDAMSDLERLLDEVTPYYKARVEEYQTPLQRATIDAIALHWDPVTTSQLAKITGVPSTTLSPQLIRLRKDGLIESAKTSGTYSGYQIAERFLNIWYLMRHGTRRNKQRMRWLVAFLSSFYSRKDLEAIDQEAKANGLAAHWTKDYADAFEQAQQRAEPSLNKHRYPDIRRDSTTGQNTEEISSYLKEAIEILKKNIALGESGDTVAEIAAYDAFIERFEDSKEPALLELVARAMSIKGLALGKIGDTTAEIAAYDALIAHFGSSKELKLLKLVAKTMFFKGITLGQSNDKAMAIETYDALIARFGDSTDPTLLVPVAKAMLNKGIILDKSSDIAMAIETYDNLIARFGDSNDPTLLEPVAKAMLNKGITLDQSGDIGMAIATYEALIMRFINNNEVALMELVARAMAIKGLILGESGNTTAAIENFDALIARFGDSFEAELQEPIARAMFNKGIALDQSGNTTAEIATYDALIARFASSSEPALLERVASAMLNKGVTLGQSGDTVAEVTAYDALITRFEDSTEPKLLEQVANAMFNKCITLDKSDDDAALETCDAFITRFSDSTEPALLELVAKAMSLKGVILGESDDTAAAMRSYDQALTLLERLSTKTAKLSEADVAIRLANMLFDNEIDTHRAEALFLQAAEHSSLAAYANLFWLYISTGRGEEAKQANNKLEQLPPKGRALIDSARAFEAENFGEATGQLQVALSGDLVGGDFDFTDDIERLIRLAIARGFGERLIAWFEKTRFSERYAPIYVALLAAVRGERMLLDSNPEVRHAAREIYLRLIGGRYIEKGEKN